MIKKKKVQLSFAQLQVNNCLDKTNWLHNVNKLLDWAPIRQKFANLHPSNTGRPAYDPVFMFKILLMQQWFNLSDPQAEAQINDRISFKIFLGMDITDTGPDETTICNFRNYIGSIGLADDLFEEINKQFEQKGLIVKTGTLIGASFYQASTKPPAKGKEAKDSDAARGAKGKGKNKKYCYGYKVHIGVDQGSGIVRKTGITNARINDHEIFNELISGNEQGVYADKAYYDKKEQRNLKQEA